MFTGIIEAIGEVTELIYEGTNVTFRIQSPLSHELKIDQSVSHNGVCLTVVGLGSDYHLVTAIDETLQKSNLGTLRAGSKVNLERCMQANGRFDGHIVQGHVDQTAVCTRVQDENGSYLFDFEYNASLGNVTVEKGSICINGVSLTVFNSEINTFRVAIIPYTFDHTTFSSLSAGDSVNLEFDIVGKYVKRLLGKV
ncbi:MAG: riboflavin synthase [Siphonobacter sp.]